MKASREALKISQPPCALNLGGPEELGFGVPYVNTFFLKGSIMKYKFILFSSRLLKSPEIGI